MTGPLPLVITPGDRLGIGPEVTAEALLEWHTSVIVIGDAHAFGRAADAVGLAWHLGGGVGIMVIDPGDELEPVEVAAVRAAVEICRSGRGRALVTGPIHKARLAARGFPYPGHTDFLGHLCGVENPVMAFVGGAVRVALVTVHLPLREVADAVTTERVLHTIRTADGALRGQLGLSTPRLAVCGLNPHAGDGGLLGHEDASVIAPAVAAAHAIGIEARGPVSSESAFRMAVAGTVDLVVAMYHDQGLAPLKSLDVRRGPHAGTDGPPVSSSVNWTLGLPIVRTSVDHGTADDIAGQGLADPSSMRAALALAHQLAPT